MEQPKWVWLWAILPVALLAGTVTAKPREKEQPVRTVAEAKHAKDLSVIAVTPDGKTTTTTLSVTVGAKATVLLFVAPACPITNAYAPEVKALAATYAKQGVAVALVYPNAGTTATEAVNHARAYGLSDLPLLLDSDGSLARTLGASVTPEAFVLDSDRSVRYQGRIDDRYVSRGTAQTTGAKSHDLKNALDSVLAGKSVAVAKTKPVGCVIEAPAVATKREVTYTRDIAPILNQNCVSCHRAGEIGPMPFDTYEASKSYAKNIASVTEARLMPPWKPVNAHGTFQDERRLNDTEIQALQTWAETGAPQGDVADAKPAPTFPTGWHLGKPDLVLTMPEEWTIPASGPDIYRCFVLPTGLTEDKDVVAIEYRAGNKSVVHHALGFIDTKGQARKKDAAAPGAGYTSFGGPGFLPSGELGGWVPGNEPAYLPDGIGRELPKNSDIVLQVHYHPVGKEEKDRTQIGLYFAKKPVSRHMKIFPMGIRQIDIAPGESDYKLTKTMTVPMEVEAIGITPHMHLLGKTFEMNAVLPDGTKKSLVEIRDWDFNWQGTYLYKDAVKLPRGTKITLTATYDNSASNPRNPNSPPKRVTHGEETTDEMCIGFLSFVTDSDSEKRIGRLKDLLRRLPKRQGGQGLGGGKFFGAGGNAPDTRKN